MSGVKKNSDLGTCGEKAGYLYALIEGRLLEEHDHAVPRRDPTESSLIVVVQDSSATQCVSQTEDSGTLLTQR